MACCPATSSGLKTTSGSITTAPGRLRGVQVGTDGTNAATVIIYDNASAASGTVLAKVVVAGASRNGSPWICEEGIVANNGIYLSIAGTGAEAVVLYDLG